MKQVKEYKKKEVESIKQLMESYPIIGIADITSLPSMQLQSIRFSLKPEGVVTKLSKKRLIKLAVEQIKDKNNINELEKFLTGIPLLIFSKKDSFKLAKELKKSKTSAPAKPGQIAPSDLVVPEGPTDFTPGPIIGELGQLGLKTAVEGGKIAIKEAKVVAKQGDIIDQKVASVLAKLGIEPMKIGLNLVATYENGIIFSKELEIDEEQYLENLKIAASEVMNLSINIGFPTKDNIKLLLLKSSMEGLSLSSKIDFDNLVKKETVEEPKPEVKEIEEPKVEAPEETVEEKNQETKEETHNEKVEEKKEEVKTMEETKPENKFKEDTEKAQEVLKNLQDEKMKQPLSVGPKPEKPITKGPDVEDLVGK